MIRIPEAQPLGNLRLAELQELCENNKIKFSVGQDKKDDLIEKIQLFLDKNDQLLDISCLEAIQLKDLSADNLKMICKINQLDTEGDKETLAKRIIKKNKTKKDPEEKKSSKDKSDRHHTPNTEPPSKRFRTSNTSNHTVFDHVPSAVLNNAAELTDKQKDIDTVANFFRDFPTQSLRNCLESVNNIDRFDRIDRMSLHNEQILQNLSSLIRRDVIPQLRSLTKCLMTGPFQNQYQEELRLQQLLAVSQELPNVGAYRESSTIDGSSERVFLQEGPDWMELLPSGISNVISEQYSLKSPRLYHYGSPPNCLPSAIAHAEKKDQQEIRDTVSAFVLKHQNEEIIRDIVGEDVNGYAEKIKNGLTDASFAFLYSFAANRPLTIWINTGQSYSSEIEQTQSQIRLYFNGQTYFLIDELI